MADAATQTTGTTDGGTAPPPQTNGATPPPDGAPGAGGSSPAPSDQNQDGAPANGAEPGPDGGGAATDPPQRPEGLPEEFWDPDQGAVKQDELIRSYGELAARDAERTAVEANRPEDPSGYEIALPQDFEAPEGAEINISADHPVYGPVLEEARTFAHENGLPQDEFTRLIGIAAKRDAAEFESVQAQLKAEHDSLGPKASERVNAVERWLTARVGESPAKTLIGVMQTKAQVEAFEGLIAQFSRHGVPAPGAGGRTGTGRIEGWDQMSPTQKFAAARERAQKSGR